MQRKQDDLISIGEVVADLDGPVKAIREASPQARHHFTRFDQVNQLVGASEADPEIGFMARMMVLCSLPRTNPGNRIRYIRQNGPYTLVMTAGGKSKLPFGNFPPAFASLGLDRSGTDPKPRARSRPLACRVHANARGSTTTAADAAAFKRASATKWIGSLTPVSS